MEQAIRFHLGQLRLVDDDTQIVFVLVADVIVEAIDRQLAAGLPEEADGHHGDVAVLLLLHKLAKDAPFEPVDLRCLSPSEVEWSGARVGASSVPQRLRILTDKLVLLVAGGFGAFSK